MSRVAGARGVLIPPDERSCRSTGCVSERIFAMREITVGCCQFESEPGNVEVNLVRVEEFVAGFAGDGVDLLVLPEMWSCAFPPSHLGAMAEKTPMVLERLAEWASRHGMVLVGSLPEADGAVIYNTSYVVERSGEIVGKYRKMHRFSFTGEDRHFGRGEETVVCPTSVGKLGIMICYDLRFPEVARRLALDGAEIICVSAQWPVPRIDHWSILLRSRAIENQLFVLGCNGCGREGKLQYAGKSVVVSPYGNVPAEAGAGTEKLTARIDVDEVARFRKHITCFADRLPGAYGLF